MRSACVAAAAVLALGATAAHGYSEPLHALLTERALAQPGETLSPPAPEELANLRALFWRLASELPDAALRAKFLARHPAAAGFDAWAFKELLMLDPAATVHGFDPTRDEARPLSRRELLALASRWPDDDERNRNRFLRDDKRQPVKGADGAPVPYDPRTLWLGALSGPTSQGHAHYGLLPGGYSSDPDVLKKDPRHFAIPAEIRAFGQDFAQIYADLAIVAASSGLPSSAWLSATFTGAAIHHVQDVGNQIHTVQVGTYDYFRSAWTQSKLRDLRTLGGLLGPRRSLEQLGLRLIANHHLFSEDLFAKRVGEAAAGRPAPSEVRAVIDGITRPDAQFLAAIAGAAERAGAEGPIVYAVTDAVVDLSSVEGPEVYALAWKLSDGRLRDGAGHEYKSPGDDPDEWLRAPGAEREQVLARFYEVEGRGLVRAGNAVRALVELHDVQALRAAQLRPAAVARILSTVLPQHEEAARRRAAYRPASAEQGVAWGYAIAALAAVILAGVLILRLGRRAAR